MMTTAHPTHEGEESYSRPRAALAVIVVLGVALAIALTPYATGLIGIPVLYVLFKPVHDWLARRMRDTLAATLIVALIVVVVIVVGGTVAALVVSEGQRLAGTIGQSPLVARISELRVGNVDVGAKLGELSSKIVAWIGSSAFGFIGTASRLALNLTITCFGLFYLLLRPGETWAAVRPYIPFSEPNTERLQQRFRDITTSSVIGTGLSAAAHGALVGLGFWVAGLPNAALWSVVTMIFAVLPVLGSGMVWGPGAIVLLVNHRPQAAVLLALWGIVVVGNLDYVIRPMVSRHWGKIHPLVTLIGALVGVPTFGLLGLLVGPLAISYFFELISMYRGEYLHPKRSGTRRALAATALACCLLAGAVPASAQAPPDRLATFAGFGSTICPVAGS
jgi:predicted PurR-regulated permease PerM